MLDSLGVQIESIAAGSRHSGFITATKDLFMFGLGSSGQLGLGDECTDKVFKPELVQGVKASQIACGDTHSLMLTTEGQLMTTGSNDKY